jgi:MoxR-like ATPase
MRFEGPQDVATALRGVDYLADDRIAQVVFLAGRLDKPVLVEGPAGVGKTELAKAMAAVTGRELIRLQCYEGLDEAKALYEWNYKKQLLRIQSDVDHDWDSISHDILGSFKSHLSPGLARTFYGKQRLTRKRRRQGRSRV